MHWTRVSFFYLIGYLGLGGVGLLAAPELAVRLLGSNGTYPTVLLRFLGAFMVALAIIVFQVVRQRVEGLYATTLVVRLFLLVVMFWLFLDSRDPLFLTLIAIVGLGMIFTTLGFIADRKATA